MKKIFTKILVLIIGAQLTCAPIIALELDTSIDDEIRKNYNPSKIEEDMALPALPKIINAEKNSSPNKIQSSLPPKSQTTPVENKNRIEEISNFKANAKTTTYNENNYIKLNAKTKIKVKSNNSISDKSKKGTRVTFTSKYPVTTTYFTIPSGTILNGTINDSHRPQLSGNGGLIVIKIDSMKIDEQTYPLNAYVSKANYKNIFFNNIKGQRRYMKSLSAATRPGRHFFNKMTRVSATLIGNGSSAIFSPFSFALGLIALGGNAIVSPVIALFYKGGNITIPAGSDFELRLSDDTYINKY